MRRRTPPRRRRATAVIAPGLLVAALALAGCEEHTVAVRFEPDVGAEYAVTSDVETVVERTVDGVAERVTDAARLEATETVVRLDDDAVTMSVSVTRDGQAERTFEVRLDRANRLTAIDLIEGVPASALGIDVGADVPAGVSSPPTGPLTPGMRWDIRSVIEIEGVDEPLVVTGTGRIRALGVEDGVEVAIAEVELLVPVRSVVTTADGRVTLRGTQRTKSETAYDLADGAATRDTTTIRGDVDLLVEPPLGIDAAPVEAAIAYDVVTRTVRRRS